MLQLRSIFTIGISFLFTASLQARTAEQIGNDMLEAANVTVSTYKSSGMSGLISSSKTCYKNLAKMKFYCLYIDVAARHIDEVAGGGSKFPRNDYFTDKQFLPRAKIIFTNSGASMDDANEYLRNSDKVISKMVDQAITKQFR